MHRYTPNRAVLPLGHHPEKRVLLLPRTHLSMDASDSFSPYGKKVDDLVGSDPTYEARGPGFESR
jgi:hypothetical protein